MSKNQVKKIKLGDKIKLPCGATLKITQLTPDGSNHFSKGGLAGVRVFVPDAYSGALNGREEEDSLERDLQEVTLNFYGQNIRTMIETLERIEEVVCPRNQQPSKS